MIFYLFGLCLASSWSPYSLKPHTLSSPPKGMGYEGVDCMRKNSRVYDEKICHKIASAIVDALMHQHSQTFARPD